jgi:micrococcal nuclease
MKRTPLLLSLFFWAAQAQANQLHGVVSKVQDGDTLTLKSGETTHKVRLAEIDAPELKQAFGKESRESLLSVALGKDATAFCSPKDRFGRNICKVLVDGSDLGAHQMSRGMAWVYVGYAKKGSPMFGLEATAKNVKAGLWSESNPVAPWDFRKQKTAAPQTQATPCK